jgi:hypothetical protein
MFEKFRKDISDQAKRLSKSERKDFIKQVQQTPEYKTAREEHLSAIKPIQEKWGNKLKILEKISNLEIEIEGFINEGLSADSLIKEYADCWAELGEGKLNEFLESEKEDYYNLKKIICYVKRYDSMGLFYNDIAPAVTQEGCFFVNRYGNPVSGNMYEGITSFFDGIAFVKIKDRWKLINEEENIISAEGFEDGYAQAYYFGLGPALVQIEEDQALFFIDKQGKPISEDKFEKAFSFNGKITAVNQNNEWFFIRQDGSKNSEKKYSEAVSVDKNLFFVCKDGGCFFIDSEENPVSKEIYDGAFIFDRELFMVQKNSKWFLINKNEEIISEHFYEQALPLNDNFVMVKRGGKPYLLDARGQEYVASQEFLDGLEDLI